MHMTVTAQNGKLEYNPKTKKWEDKEGNIGYDHKKVCENCGKPRLDINEVENCDFCLQGLTTCDFINYACCGHGKDEYAYINLKDGRRFVLDTLLDKYLDRIEFLEGFVKAITLTIEGVNVPLLTFLDNPEEAARYVAENRVGVNENED